MKAQNEIEINASQLAELVYEQQPDLVIPEDNNEALELAEDIMANEETRYGEPVTLAMDTDQLVDALRRIYDRG